MTSSRRAVPCRRGISRHHQHFQHSLAGTCRWGTLVRGGPWCRAFPDRFRPGKRRARQVPRCSEGRATAEPASLSRPGDQQHARARTTPPPTCMPSSASPRHQRSRSTASGGRCRPGRPGRGGEPGSDPHRTATWTNGAAQQYLTHPTDRRHTAACITAPGGPTGACSRPRHAQETARSRSPVPASSASRRADERRGRSPRPQLGSVPAWSASALALLEPDSRAQWAQQEHPVRLHPVTDDLGAAVLAHRRHLVDRALERVERVHVPCRVHLEAQPVVVAAHLADQPSSTRRSSAPHVSASVTPVS